MGSPNGPLATDEDPGWRPALQGLGWMLFPPAIIWRQRRRVESGQVDGLVALRSTVLTFGAALVLIGFVVFWLASGSPEDEGGWSTNAGVALVVASGLFDLVMIRLVRRPLDCSSDASLALSYRTRTFAHIAFADAAALVGFVGFFLTGNPLMYPLGAAFAAVGYVGIVPTVANLEREQDALVTEGCSRSLIAALRTATDWQPKS